MPNEDPNMVVDGIDWSQRDYIPAEISAQLNIPDPRTEKGVVLDYIPPKKRKVKKGGEKEKKTAKKDVGETSNVLVNEKPERVEGAPDFIPAGGDTSDKPKAKEGAPGETTRVQAGKKEKAPPVGGMDAVDKKVSELIERRKTEGTGNIPGGK